VPASPAPRTLAVTDLTVRFGGVVAVDSVSFVLRPGEVLGIIGPNGAGKTTLLDAITGFVDADAGTVALDGDRIERWAPHRRARAGLQRSFQSAELFDDLTVAENLLVSCERRSRFGAVADLVRAPGPRLSTAAEAAVEAFDLGAVLQRRPPELSFGVRRLVSVARSLAAGPSLLLLDEPAAGLSEDESIELGARIRGLAVERGLAIALIEHDMTLVLSICDRLIVLDAGRVLGAGAPADVAADPLVVAAYLGDELASTPPVMVVGR
jgi:sulfate-transporting ATPase